MANSRLEKVGNIFLRTSGLLRSGAMKPEDRPIWYDIYAAYPPVDEPRFDRPAPNVEVKNIFYSEDKIRAKFHKVARNLGSPNLAENKFKSQTQYFIDIYNKLAAQGALNDDAIFETAFDMMKDKFEQDRTTRSESVNLVADFKVAATQQQKPQTPSVDISDIFKS